MEQSADEFPLALTYRNLAVYWNSEHDMAKGSEYTQKVLDLDLRILTTSSLQQFSCRLPGAVKRP